MLTADIVAKVSWANGVSIQGKISLNYLADVDPWLVHATFRVAEVSDELEIERFDLITRVARPTTGPQWANRNGAPLRIGSADNFVRFRLTSPDTGSWADFDVDRRHVQRFLDQTTELCDYDTEKTALTAYIEKSLGEL